MFDDLLWAENDIKKTQQKIKRHLKSQVWWGRLVTPALGRLMQEDPEFEASLNSKNLSQNPKTTDKVSQNVAIFAFRHTKLIFA